MENKEFVAKIANLMLSCDKANHDLADIFLKGKILNLKSAERKSLFFDICDKFYKSIGIDELLEDIETAAVAQEWNDTLLADGVRHKQPYLRFFYDYKGHRILAGSIMFAVFFRFSSKRKFNRRTPQEIHRFFRTSLKHKTNIVSFALVVFPNIQSAYRLGGGKARDLKKVKNSYLEFVKKAAKDLQNHISSLLPLKTVKHARKIY